MKMDFEIVYFYDWGVDLWVVLRRKGRIYERKCNCGNGTFRFLGKTWTYRAQRVYDWEECMI